MHLFNLVDYCDKIKNYLQRKITVFDGSTWKIASKPFEEKVNLEYLIMILIVEPSHLGDWKHGCGVWHLIPKIEVQSASFLK
jgi:hypothetical protein